MLLPGRMESTTLGDLLGALHREGVCGTLELVEPTGHTHRICFDRGTVSGVQTPLPCPPLGQVLLDMGALSDAARRSVEVSCLSASKERLGNVLLQQALISEETLGRALRHQLQARLDAIARVPRARVSFRPRMSKDDPIALTPQEFLHGKPRNRNLRTPQASSSEDCSAPGTRGVANPSSRTEAFAVLGLEPGSDTRAVRAAFRRLAATLHPDTQFAADQSTRAVALMEFARASAAYHLLVA